MEEGEAELSPEQLESELARLNQQAELMAQGSGEGSPDMVKD